jgi:hypothetical protein
MAFMRTLMGAYQGGVIIFGKILGEVTLTKVARVLVLPHTVGVQKKNFGEAVKLHERVITIGGLAIGVLIFTS